MELTRRSLLKLGAAAVAAPLALPTPACAARPATRTLGRTMLPVSELGMGVLITQNPEVVRAALEAGLTYFDKARVYMGGRNEAILAVATPDDLTAAPGLWDLLDAVGAPGADPARESPR